MTDARIFDLAPCNLFEGAQGHSTALRNCGPAAFGFFKAVHNEVVEGFHDS